MPPYDPKANRPKLVPVDESAPVDALLGPGPDAPAEPARPHLSVVAPDDTPEPAPRVEPTPPAEASSGPDRKKLLLAAAVTTATVLSLIVVVRRRR